MRILRLHMIIMVTKVTDCLYLIPGMTQLVRKQKHRARKRVSASEFCEILETPAGDPEIFKIEKSRKIDEK